MNDVIDAAQEQTINNQYFALQNSENVIKSIQKKLVQFKQSTESLHASQKSLHEDLIALQDRFLDKDAKNEINAFFDGFSQTLLNIHLALNNIPQKINEFVQNIDNFTKNQWKKRSFLKERHEHYLNKVQALIIKQEEQAAKQNPNNFILSAGTGVGTISMQQRRNNPKFTRNNDKLKNSSQKYQDINYRVAQELGNLIKMRNGITCSISKQLTDTLVENVLLIQTNTEAIRMKNEPTTINQNSNRSNNNGGGANASISLNKMKFCSTNSVEQEMLEKEITIRGIFKIPASMELPVIRRRSIKITQDGHVKSDNDSHKKEYNPVPFESNNPNVIIYLSRLVQQDKNIFDFEDFNNKDANQEEDNSKHSNNNQVQDHSGFEGSIERVYTQNDSESEGNEDDSSENEENSDNLEICEDDDDDEQEQNQKGRQNGKIKSQKSSPETAPRKMSGVIEEKQKKVSEKQLSHNNILQNNKKNKESSKNNKDKSKKIQQKILSDSIFKYEQERKKQLINQILQREGGGNQNLTQNNSGNQLNINPSSSNNNKQSNSFQFNNLSQNQQSNNSASQPKQQISPQGSIPEKSNKSNISQGSNNQVNQLIMNSLQDPEIPQRLSQNKNQVTNPNNFHSATNQINNINVKISIHNNHVAQQQNNISSPQNFPIQNMNSFFNGNNNSSSTKNNNQANNLFFQKQNTNSTQNLQLNLQFPQQQSSQLQNDQVNNSQINQMRQNSNLTNLPSPKYFNNNSNNFSNNQHNNLNSQSQSNQVSTPQNANNNNNQQGLNQAKSQFSQQIFQSPAQSNIQQQNTNYLTPPPIDMKSAQNANLIQTPGQNRPYFQQGNQQNQQQYYYQNQQQNSRSSLPSNLNNNSQQHNQQSQNDAAQKRTSYNNLNESQQIQKNSPQPSTQQFQNYGNSNKNIQQNNQNGFQVMGQASTSYVRKNSDNLAVGYQDNFVKNNNTSLSQFNSYDNNPQNSFNNNNQKQPFTKELTFNTQYEKVVNGQMNQNNNQQQKQFIQKSNTMNFQIQANNIMNGQQKYQQSLLNGNKVQNINPQFQEEQKIAVGSQTTTNQQSNQIRNFYQQNNNKNHFEPQELQKNPLNLNKIKNIQQQNQETTSDQEDSVLSLTLIDD